MSSKGNSIYHAEHPYRTIGFAKVEVAGSNPVVRPINMQRVYSGDFRPSAVWTGCHQVHK